MPSVEIVGSTLVWDLEFDHDYRRPGDHAEQSFEDFRTYGPAWPSAPPDIIGQLVKQRGLKDPPWLVKPGYDPYSPAWHAIENGDEVSALAAAATEDPRRTYRHGQTLLMRAASHGMSQLARQLLHSGADVNACDEAGQSALLIAVRGVSPSLELIRVLTERKPDQLDEAAEAALTGSTPEIAVHLLNEGGQVRNPELLQPVAGKKWIEVVRILLARGVDPNFRNRQGGTALMWAGSREVVEALIEAGSDINAKSDDGDSVLSYAAAIGQVWKVEALLKAGANPNIRGYHYSFGSTRGQPVLQCLLQLAKYPEIVELLRAAGAR